MIVAKINSHRDLVVWQKAMDLSIEVYKLSSQFPAVEAYRMTSQLTRSAVSIPANIAEGRARTTRKDSANFLAIAQGSLAETETYLLLATKKSGIAKFDDLIGSKSKQLTIGGIPGSTVEQGPMLLRDLLGANIKVVSGYKGTADVRLAMESGELDGFFNSWESTKVTSLDRVKNGDWQILAQVGDQPIAALPVKNVPTIAQMAKTEEQQQLLRFGAYAPNQFAKVYTVPPGTPADRAAALESALTKTFTDKEFLADADKGKLDIDPVSATQVQKLVNEFFGLPAELKAKLKKILKP